METKTIAGRTFVPSVLLKGDTLATLGTLYKLAPAIIAEANGVPRSLGVNSCTWGVAVEAWVLRTGGKRLPFDPKTPNNCAPGLGFAAFQAGQVILLPAGGPRMPASSTQPSASSGGLGILGLGAVGLLAWWALS